MTHSQLLSLDIAVRQRAAERRRLLCDWEDRCRRASGRMNMSYGICICSRIHLCHRPRPDLSVHFPKVFCQSKRQILLGAALIVNHFKLPQELIYILVKLQNYSNTRQYHIDCLKIANALWGGRKDTGPALHISQLLIKINDRQSPLLKCTILSKKSHVNECQLIQRNKKIKSVIMTSWRNLHLAPGVPYIPTQYDRHMGDPNDCEYNDDY